MDATQWPGGGVASDSGDQRRWELADQLTGFQREADPLAGHAEPAVARPDLQVVAQKPPQIGQDRCRRGWVKPM
jgi:hypothetical protein